MSFETLSIVSLISILRFDCFLGFFETKVIVINCVDTPNFNDCICLNLNFFVKLKIVHDWFLFSSKSQFLLAFDTKINFFG